MADESVVQDMYCDGVQLAMSPYDIVFILTKNSPKVVEKGKVEVVQSHVGSVRMSLEHAKVLSIMLRRNLHAFEEQSGSTIPMLPENAKNLGISKEEDW